MSSLSFTRPKDKLFYGWVVVIAIFVINAIIMGIGFSFGVFFKSIESTFGLTRATTSAVFSLYMGLGCVFAIMGGWAIDRYGPKIVLLLMGSFAGLSLLLTGFTNAAWQLFITYSLLLALGSGAIYVVTMSPVLRWFHKKRGLAVGIAISGGGLGQVIFALFSTYLITTLDWRKAFIVLGLITWLIVIPISRLLKRDPYEIGALPDGVKSDLVDRQGQEPEVEKNSPVALSLLQVFKTRSFWLCTFIWFFVAVCVLLVVTHIVPHATDIGFSAGEAAGVLSLIGGATTAGMIIIGGVSDRIGRKKTAVICSLLQAGTMAWLIWAQQLWMLYLFALVYGFVSGGFASTFTALIGDSFGLPSIGRILGVLELGWGFGAALGPIIGGLIFDFTNSYSIAFLIGAIAMVAATLLIGLVRRETE